MSTQRLLLSRECAEAAVTRLESVCLPQGEGSRSLRTPSLTRLVTTAVNMTAFQHASMVLCSSSRLGLMMKKYKTNASVGSSVEYSGTDHDGIVFRCFRG